MFDSLDLRQTMQSLGHLVLAFALALPLGWERGLGRSSVGFRTLPVVAMASCGYALIASRLPGANAESITRMVQGLAAGIGFVGGGAILKSGGHVRGLVTAASIWSTGAIGAAVALDRAEVAVVLSAANFLALALLTPIAQGRAAAPPKSEKVRGAEQAHEADDAVPRRLDIDET
jgi:putative Mg2+ transporter-C (MgtC) family protein